MFDKSPDERLSSWAQFRNRIETSNDPLTEVCEFWKSAPFVAYNHRVDPFHSKAWPTPWEIIVENKYDDFTKSLMMGYTLKLTKKYSKSKIELRRLVDNQKPTAYNICCVEDQWVLNYSDEGPVPTIKVPDYYLVENLIELTTFR